MTFSLATFLHKRRRQFLFYATLFLNSFDFTGGTTPSWAMWTCSSFFSNHLRLIFCNRKINTESCGMLRNCYLLHSKSFRRESKIYDSPAKRYFVLAAKNTYIVMMWLFKASLMVKENNLLTAISGVTIVRPGK